MKVFNSKTKIGRYFNTDLYIDFGDLFKYHGERHLKDQVDQILGRISVIIGFLLLIGPILNRIFYGTFTLESFLRPKEFIEILPYFSIYFFLYGWYLLRDKAEFLFNLENLNLRDLIQEIKFENPKEIEIDNYFSEQVLSLIDKAYFQDHSRFLQIISNNVLHNEEILELLNDRLSIVPGESVEAVDKQLNAVNTSFENAYQMFFLRSFSEAVQLGVEQIDISVLFFILAKYYWVASLRDFDIHDSQVTGLAQWYRNERLREYYKKQWKLLSKLKPTGAINRSYTSKATPTLDDYGEDLTNLATKEFVTAIGKDDAMVQTIKNLQQESGSALLILGEPGVGKSFFLRNLATKMVVEDVPDKIKDYRLVALDLSKTMAKASSVDNFKGILQDILEEIVTSDNIIVAFEEIGQIFNLRDEGRLEVVNLITNMLDKHKMKIIGTSNYADYTKLIKPIKGFAALFDIVEIPEPSEEIAFQILMDFVPELEKEYDVKIRSSAVKRVVEFGSKVSYERSMPAKGIDLLEESIIKAKQKHLDFIDNNTVDELLEEKIGVNIGEISSEESKKLQRLEEAMHQRVIGQDHAIRSIAAALKRARSGLTSGKRPVASFLFYGPTGVGKTEVAKTLADVYYGEEDLMIRLDMSEYQEEINVPRLLGYTDLDGNFIGGYLTEAVRKKPFSLILFDEIEKANPQVLDLFLQLLDEGHLTDGLGRKIDFTNTIIIATSNAGSKQIAELISAGKRYEEVQKETKQILNDVFRIEFLNRFDKIIMFKPLAKIEILQIADILLNKVKEKLEEKNMSLSWDKSTLELLSVEGYNPVFGARELRRVIQERIEDKVADLIVAGQVKSGNEVRFGGLEVVQIVQ